MSKKCSKNKKIGMKERIRQVMESLHLTQQEFAERTQIGAATLSNIFNDRTRPTLNVVELIKKNIPDISTDWLLLGVGSMYVTQDTPSEASAQPSPDVQNPSLPFIDDFAPAPTPQREPVTKIVEKPQRKVTEIRVYYDDQTWESFLPSKSR